MLGVRVTVTQAERTRRRADNRPGVIKCQLSSLDEKVTVLRNKRKAAQVDDYKRVFIARMRSHEERLIELNFKAILKDMPNGDQYRMTGSGRLVDTRDAAADAGDGTSHADEVNGGLHDVNAVANGGANGGDTRPSGDRNRPLYSTVTQSPRQRRQSFRVQQGVFQRTSHGNQGNRGARR